MPGLERKTCCKHPSWTDFGASPGSSKLVPMPCVHGHCHVWPWLIEFSGVALTCFTRDRLEERGVERRSTRRSSLKGWERAVVSQTNIGIVSKAVLGKLLRDGEVHTGFSKHIGIFLKWTELFHAFLLDYFSGWITYKNWRTRSARCSRQLFIQCNESGNLCVPESDGAVCRCWWIKGVSAWCQRVVCARPPAWVGHCRCRCVTVMSFPFLFHITDALTRIVTHTAKFARVLVRSHACVQVMHRSELLELSLYLLFISLSVFAGIKRRTIIEYHRVAFMKEQIEQGTVIILTPLPSESIAAWPVLRVAKLYMHWKFRTDNFDNNEIFVKLHWCIMYI